MKKEILILLLVGVIIISFSAGFWIGKIYQKKQAPEKAEVSKKLTEAKKEIETLKEQLETFYPPLPKEIKEFIGKVVDKGKDFLVVETEIRVSRFPLPGGKEMKKIKVKVKADEKTEIFKIEAPSFSSPGEMPAGPRRPAQRISLSLNDIQIGDYVSVVSRENVKETNEVVAVEIQVLPQAGL